MTKMKNLKSGRGGAERIRSVGAQKETRRRPCWTRRILL
jgi:hypothetical protein